MKFEVPSVAGEVSPLSAAAIQLAAIAGRLAVEERTIVHNTDGRSENVAEHSNMLAIVAPALAAEFFPALDPGRVALYCPVHDIVEAYVGDTPTHDIDEQGLIEKIYREQQGLGQLRKDYAYLPTFVALVDEYEAQIAPETRFVRMVDKLMPLLVHVNDAYSGLLKVGYTPEAIRTNSQIVARQFRAEYPDMRRIIAAREELAELVATGLAERQK